MIPGERRSRHAPLRASILAFALACPILGPAGAAEEAIGGDMIVTKGMKPWEGCGECHSLDGIAPNPHFPNLAAQRPEYFRKQMADFRDGRRQNDHGQMGTSSRELSEGALAQIAVYFAGLEPPPARPAGGVPPEALVRGARLVGEGSRADKIPACANCHGNHPKHDFAAPCLGAQPAGYTEKQLKDFKAGRRTNDPDQVMQKIVRNLSDDDVAAVSAYLAELGPGADGSCKRAAE